MNVVVILWYKQNKKKNKNKFKQYLVELSVKNMKHEKKI